MSEPTFVSAPRIGVGTASGMIARALDATRATTATVSATRRIFFSEYLRTSGCSRVFLHTQQGDSCSQEQREGPGDRRSPRPLFFAGARAQILTSSIGGRGGVMSDHLDGPNFTFPEGDPRLDVADLYLFEQPGDPARAVVVFDVNPFAAGPDFH